jgi:hypothetical protein
MNEAIDQTDLLKGFNTYTGYPSLQENQVKDAVRQKELASGAIAPLCFSARRDNQYMYPIL